ncbi:DUF3052 domain-containing protein [Nakamurella silvestris]|nr:DUF3052 domain-containing protein [Nakamurella silvestris]
MNDVAGSAGRVVARLGLTAGNLVGEFGYDDDVDHDLRDAIEDLIGSEMLDENADDVVDAVLLWWREDDGDLTDALVDALTPLADSGVVWLLTPKTGRDGYVEPSDVSESAKIAGMSATTSSAAGPDWTLTRLVRPKSEIKVRR